jgi:hypothetical protein
MTSLGGKNEVGSEHPGSAIDPGRDCLDFTRDQYPAG